MPSTKPSSPVRASSSVSKSSDALLDWPDRHTDAKWSRHALEVKTFVSKEPVTRDELRRTLGVEAVVGVALLSTGYDACVVADPGMRCPYTSRT